MRVLELFQPFTRRITALSEAMYSCRYHQLQFIFRLDRVAAHRAVFFRRSRDAQESFRPGSLRLVPADDRRAYWRRDYDAMRESMFFSESPEFGEILAVVSRFEEDFNSLRHRPPATNAQP